MRILPALLLWCVLAAPAVAQHTAMSVSSPFPIGAAAPAMVDAPVGTTATIYIRFLGYDCSHCVRQLVYLNSYADDLYAAGIRVVAFSNDDPKRCAALVRAKGLDQRVFSVVSDGDNAVARSISAIRIENGEELDLHAAIVVRQGMIRFAVYGTEPFMDVQSLVQSAIDGTPMMVSTEGVFSEYLHQEVTATVVAGPDQGINKPVDLAFNRSILHGNDLWVVQDETNRGSGVAILHNAAERTTSVDVRKDSRAYHFMWRAHGIAFGTNGAFATAQNGSPGNGQLQYLFMGPTLWSADTAIFARAYQGSQDFLASHLDMLHQSAWCLGIAHEQGNAYWVSDARNKMLYRFDFADPHEVGGTDHRDGVVRRYDDATLTPPERGIPAHLEVVPKPGSDFGITNHDVIYVDPGARAVKVLDVNSARANGYITAIAEQDELLRSNVKYTDALVATLVDTGLIEPVGLAVHKASRRMLIGDRANGRIHVYDLPPMFGQPALYVGTIQTPAEELLGIEIDPNGRIWYVDRARHEVVRLDAGGIGTVTLSQNVIVLDSGTRSTVTVTYTNTSTTPHDLTFTVGAPSPDVPNDALTLALPATRDTVKPGETVNVDMTIDLSVPRLWTDYVITTAVRDASNGSDLGMLTERLLVAASGTDRIIVNDATEEVYDLASDVNTLRAPYYVVMPSSVFLRLHDLLPSVKTLAWHAGSFGRISDVDEAVISDLLGKDVDVLLTADDPLILRSELPQSSAFFLRFGATFKGSDGGDTTDDGRRIVDGVVNDPITQYMRGVDCQLPRLKHHRGGWLVPAVRLAPGTAKASPFLTKRDSDTTYAVRFEVDDRRTAIIGMNLARVVDDMQRSGLLDSTLVWLEGGYTIPVSVQDERGSGAQTQGTILTCAVHDGVVTVEHAYGSTDIGVYTLGGARVATVFAGTAAGTVQAQVNTGSLSSGTYFVVVRTANGIAHAAMVNRR